MSKAVFGLGYAYRRFEQDAPSLAVGHGAAARLMRLIAPAAILPLSLDQEFYCLEWPGGSPEVILGAFLEKVAPHPVQVGWGAYLLSIALDRHCASPLISGGYAPSGYTIHGGVNWLEMISEGLKSGQITLEGAIKAMPASLPARMPAKTGIV